MIEPLAFRIRPKTLDEIKGQDHIIGKDKILTRMIEEKRLFSIIFYGEPGTGKTTIAMALAEEIKVPYRIFNAVTGNKKDLDAIFLEAKITDGLVLIIDEIHRLNKDKQDLLLPYVENGKIILLGATTSNPLFAINPAIRSRCHLLEVKSLNNDDLKKVLLNAIKKDNIKSKIDDEALVAICKKANGDVRYALNILDMCQVVSKHITKEIVEQYSILNNSNSFKDDDGHYDLLSAFQKSIRGSDVNAALYYLAKLLQINDMVSLERRLLVTAYEDIGLANPAAVSRVIDAIETAKRVGFPEAMIPLSFAVIDLTLSPKSRSATNAIHEAFDTVNNTNYKIPNYLKLNYIGIDDEDKYDYSNSSIWHKIQYLPDNIKDIKFYNPNINSSYEKQLALNYENLLKTKRTSNIKSLKNSNKTSKI